MLDANEDYQELPDAIHRTVAESVPPSDNSSFHAFQSISIVDVVEQDPRPAFVVDLKSQVLHTSLDPIFTNSAFQGIHDLYDVVVGRASPSPYGQPSTQTYSAFKKWVLDVRGGDLPAHLFVYNGISWTGMLINSRWKVINGIRARRQEGITTSFDAASWEPKPAPFWKQKGTHQEITSVADERSSAATFLQQAMGLISSRPGFDITSEEQPADVSSHILFVRSVDWASTPLGAMKTWSSQLRHTVNILMATPNPAIVLWGPEPTCVYNASYPLLVPNKHPWLMGASAPQAFGQAWDMFYPFYQTCVETGRGATFDDMLIFIDRGFGHQEETYWSLTLTPIVGEENNILGWFEPVVETTKRKIGERRMKTILEVGEKISKAQDTKTFWCELLKGLEPNVHDISFAMAYSVQENLNSISQQNAACCRKCVELQGTINVPNGHIAAPKLVEAGVLHGLPKFFKEAHDVEEPLFLKIQDGSLPPELVDGLTSRGFLDPCTSLVILQIAPTTGWTGEKQSPLGFLVVGLNTRRPYDNEYQQFIRVLRRQIDTSLASVLLLEEEVRRGRTIAEQAAIDQRVIEDKLRLRTAELEKRNLQLKHFADSVPVGIFVLDFTPEHPHGQYVYRNDIWFELTAGNKHYNNLMESDTSPNWGRLHFEDAEHVRDVWAQLVTGKKLRTSFEFRVCGVGKEADKKGVESTWILAYCFAVVDQDRKLKSIIGSLTDITAQKWAESVQRRRAEDIMESKRQQENFIDVTSHEMRNPLSAVMISADDITASLGMLKKKTVTLIGEELHDLLDSSIEAAGVIAQCAQHQKRIVDDILTISKLDSGLFSFNPTEAHPIVVVKNLLKMFDAEFASTSITAQLDIMKTFNDLQVDLVMLDSSRLLQILINLITNAIKFTKYCETRLVTLKMSASREPPKKTLLGQDYLELRMHREDLVCGKDWGQGQVLYLEFAVEDTGRGLSEDEKQILFRRFSQAPKTHVHYGGSGLGLFISRELTELQGGQIAVSSPGKDQGSTFSFYIRTRRALNVRNKPINFSRKRAYSVDANEAHAGDALRSVQAHRHLDASMASFLPIQTQTLAQAETLSNHLSQPSSQSQSAAQVGIPAVNTPIEAISSISQHQYHTLVVEDNLTNQRVLARQLQRLGHTVHVANHGLEALEFLEKTAWRRDDRAKLSTHRTPSGISDVSTTSQGSDASHTSGSPHSSIDVVQNSRTALAVSDTNLERIRLDVVLMDSEMPVMSGLECVRQIRFMEKQGALVGRVPVIAITANARPEQVNELMGAGVDRVFTKPFRVNELVEGMDTVIRTR
jgi:signal transduction histidine kinase/CheY-like chemotaxis protein